MLATSFISNLPVRLIVLLVSHHRLRVSPSPQRVLELHRFGIWFCIQDLWHNLSSIWPKLPWQTCGRECGGAGSGRQGFPRSWARCISANSVFTFGGYPKGLHLQVQSWSKLPWGMRSYEKKNHHMRGWSSCEKGVSRSGRKIKQGNGGEYGHNTISQWNCQK